MCRVLFRVLLESTSISLSSIIHTVTDHARGCRARQFSMLLWSALLLSSAPTQATDKEHTASCADLHPRCFGWAQRGLCTELWEFMHADCTASCGACTEAALTKDPCAPRAEGDLQAPGSLRAAFDRAAGHVQLEPTLHSAEPPIVTLDGFMSADEAAEVVRVAEAIGFHPSGSGCGGNRALCNMGYIHCDSRPRAARRRR